MSPDIDGTWAVWSMHVLEELKRLNVELKATNAKLDTDLSALRKDFEDLRVAFIEFKTTTDTESKIKNGIWGAVAGAIISLLLILGSHLIGIA